MMEINGTNRVRFGAYEADLHTHELWKHGTKIKLIGQPFEILAVLVSRPGQLVTREELRALLWPGDTFVDFNHGLNAAVNKLRDALCDSAEDPKYIETLPRRGYRFVAAVEASTPAAASAVTPGVADPTHETQPLDLPATTATIFAEELKRDAVPAYRNASPRAMKWFRYAVLLVGLVLGLWRIANWLHAGPEQEAKLKAERAGASTVEQLAAFSDPTSEPAFSPDGNRVVFRRESFVPGMTGLYVKQVNGEEFKQLTSDKNDCCAVWSPDGKWLAFSRLTEKDRLIFTVPAEGGNVRQLFATPYIDHHEELDWSPDGKSLAYVGQTTGNQTAIFFLSLDSSTPRAVTMPEPNVSDWGPAFSPDGERLAFVRGSPGQASIMVMPAGGGEVRQLAGDLIRMGGPPVWSSDGQSVIFSAETGQHTGLFRVDMSGGPPTPIDRVSGMVIHPTVSKRGFYLAYEQRSIGRGIHQLDLYPAGQRPRPLVVTPVGNNAGGQISPDGTKLLFGSTRLGSSDIWVTNRDGSNPVQLTSIGTAGTPRWSPDGKNVVFDVGQGDWQQPHATFVVGAEGGSLRPLVQDSFDNPAPSWSRDGEWIYFPSNRSGSWQVWKIPANGGNPVQMTTQGGFAAWEGPDHTLYYAKNRFDYPELWKVPLAGGTEAPVYPPIRPLDWASWAIVGQGIYYAETGPDDRPVLTFFDFKSLAKRRLAVFDRAPFWLAVSPEGKSVVFDQPEDQYSHVMLERNFR